MLLVVEPGRDRETGNRRPARKLSITMNGRHGFVAIAFAALVAGTANAQPLAGKIWFGPEMPLPVGAASPYMGSIDYRALFTTPDAWAKAARSVRVFVLH